MARSIHYQDALAVLTMGAVIGVDQLTKEAVANYFAQHPGTIITVLGSIFNLELVHNTGVAFGLLHDTKVLGVLIAVAIIVIGLFYRRYRNIDSLLLKLSFGLVLGGAIGNLIDRIRHTYVVDFLHINYWPVFNVADSSICVGVVLLAFYFWRQGRREESPTPEPSPATDNQAEVQH